MKVQALERVFDLLELLSREQDGLSLLLNNMELKTEAQPVLRELAGKTGNTVFLAALQEGQVVYIDKMETFSSLRKYSIIGQRAPLYCTAVGKATLSGMSKLEIRRLYEGKALAAFTPRTITEVTTLLAEIERTRERGWSIDDEEYEPGLRGIGAAIRDYRDQLIAAVSTSGSIAMMPRERIEEFSGFVIAAARDISGLRSLIAIPVLLLFLRRPRITWSVPQVGAAVAYSATVITFVTATKLTTAANAILLQYTSPIFVALLAGWLLGGRVGWPDWLAIGAVLAGLCLFFLDRLSLSGLAGNLVAIGSGLSFAFLLIFLRQQRSGSPMESIVLGNILTAAIGLPFLFGAWPDRSGWLAITLLGVFQLGLPYVVYTRAIRNVTAVQAILIKGVEPLLNPLWVYVFLGEAPGTWALIGGVIVFVSITLRSAVSAIGAKNRQ